MMRTRMGEEFGLQAQFDWWALKGMMRHMDPIIPHTFVPMLRMLSAKPDTVDEQYRAVRGQRSIIRWRDSPRVRWTKRYGNFIRELQWVSKELKGHMPKEQYEAFVTGTLARNIEGWIGFLKPALAKVLPKAGDTPIAREGENVSRREQASHQATQRFFRLLNFGGFLVGPMELTTFDTARGMVAYVPRCGMHTVVSETEPQTEACLRSCKAACEQVFGEGSPVKMHFEPHLPNLDCTLRVTWDGSPPAQFEDPRVQLLRKRKRVGA